MKVLSLVFVGATIALPFAFLPQTGRSQDVRIQDLDHRYEAKLLQPIDQSISSSNLAQADPTPGSSPAASPTTNLDPRQYGFYGTVSTNARFVTKATIEPINASITISPGFGINAAAGYRFRNNVRLEGEFSYGSNNVDEARLPTIPGTSTTLTTTTPVVTTTIPLTTATAFTTPINIPIPGVGVIPAGTTIPAGIELTRDANNIIRNVNSIAVGPVTIPAGTNLSQIPGITTTGGTTQTTGGTTETVTITTPDIPAATVKVGGKITTLSGLFNVYYDIPTGSRFEPYIGAGVGVSRASADDLSAGYPGTTIRYNLSGSTTAFVYQFRGGVAYNFGANAAVTLGYRYFNVPKQSFDAGSLGELDVDGLGVHNVELGFRYFF